MITFLLSIVLLVLGHLFYGKFVEKVFGVDPKAKTPATLNPRVCNTIKMVVMTTTTRASFAMACTVVRSISLSLTE